MLITACPTFTNPDAIDDIATLRRELHAANEQIFMLADQLHETRANLRHVAGLFSRVLLLHADGSHDAVRTALDAAVAQYVRASQADASTPH